MLASTSDGLVDDLLEDRQQTLAGMAERIEATGFDHGLDGALVEHRHVDALAEVVEVGERAVLAFDEDLLDETLADVAHRGETEDDRTQVERSLWRHHVAAEHDRGVASGRAPAGSRCRTS